MEGGVACIFKKKKEEKKKNRRRKPRLLPERMVVTGARRDIG